MMVVVEVLVSDESVRAWIHFAELICANSVELVPLHSSSGRGTSDHTAKFRLQKVELT